jgi:hypothetical protein
MSFVFGYCGRRLPSLESGGGEFNDLVAIVLLVQCNWVDLLSRK